MNNWDIRKQIIALALLPILVVATVLTGYFTFSQLEFISASLVRHANIIARQLAPVSEYAVFSGNIESLNPILKITLSNEDIIGIRISDTENNTLISIDDSNNVINNKSLWHKFANEELTTFKEPIKSQTLQLDAIDDYNTDPDKSKEIIGYIELTLSSKNINAKKLQAITKGALITLIILFISALMALRLSRKISKPVQDLTRTVKKISSGDYNARINQQALGELGILESCVNLMAKELQSSRDDLEDKIQTSTKELHETMEELEIRNAEIDISRSKAIKASEAKSEFLASMSHELRTPLGGILGFSELLVSTDLEPQQRDYSEIIKKSAYNLLHIIDGVLDLSKIEAGKLDINYSEFNVTDIAEEVIDLLTPVAYEKNIELTYHFTNGTPDIINSDANRIRQILINLIGNAIKFTEKGHVCLHIYSTHTSDSSTTVIFSIIDTGIGMTPAQQKNLFEAFTQADSTIEQRYGGTGLGLVISKKLAKLIHGDITFDSTHNNGSVFRLNIASDTYKFDNSNKSALTNKNICLINPHKCCESGTRSMLESWGGNISTYTNSPEAYSNFDIIITNICREDMHIDKIKTLVPDTESSPVLAIASTRSYKDLEDIKEYGFDEAVFRSSGSRQILQSILNLISPEKQIKTANFITQGNTFNWSNINVLVVDDNNINLKLAEIILDNNGVNVTTALSGHEGLNYAKEKKFDLILMDLQMPDLDGYETSKRIRQEETNKNTTIIALTANALATKESRRIEQCGMNDILIKPINTAIIQNTINHWVLKQHSNHPLPEKAPKIETTLFSRTDALELAAGNRKLANELTKMMIGELPDHLENINNALSNNDIERLKQVTHKLHGASRCCGTPALRHAAEQLEQDIDLEIFEHLEADTRRLIHEIEKLITADEKNITV